jgi:peptidoglycan L-alanyl-D-glutamate endopeptidase CwlK
MTFAPTIKSLKKLDGVHPDLIKVVMQAYAMTEVNFYVLEGLRTLEQEKVNVAKGASQTLNSRHLTGHAVDIAAVDEEGRINWAWPNYEKLAKTFKEVAKDLEIALEWGGDWKTLKDGGHFQLPWKQYPIEEEDT